jgi:hypothetical protein
MSKKFAKTKKGKPRLAEASPQQLLLTDLENQHNYVESLKAQGDRGFALIAASAFVKGMRDSGYRSTATAIDELIDNAYQSQASRVDLVCSCDSNNRVEDIFVIDDGHGMEPDMIRAAVLWGGTHRFNDRTGFGRYGFGLPSAAVSMTERYAVYSKTLDGKWHAVNIDLLAIASGQLTSRDGLIVAPSPSSSEPPAFVKAYLGERVLDQGTVIHLVAPDKLTSGFRNVQSFEQKMLEHLGVIYRGLFGTCSLYVNGKEVSPIDPLFTTSTCRYYDIDSNVQAEAFPEAEIALRTQSGQEGMMRLRFSYMPSAFQLDKDGKKHRGRFNIIKENNAYLIVTRSGRQIDLVSRPNYAKETENTTIVNYDRNWAIELDFDPVLDEEFGITVNKQQVTLSEAVWLKLSESKLPSVVKDLRRRFKLDKKKHDNPDGASAEPRTSESTMKDAGRFSTRPPRPLPDEQKQQARENLQKEAESRARDHGTTTEEALNQILSEQQERPFAVLFEQLEGAPFYRVERFGLQARIYMNRAHRFYQDFYSLFSSEPRHQTVIEILLMILGECELESSGDRAIFYKAERGEWSHRLDVTLSLLDREESIDDFESAQAEDEESDDEDE